MRGLLVANPLGGDPGWIDERVEDIAKLNLDRYVLFIDNSAYLRLKALLIVAEKNGGAREFWIKEEFPRLFAWCLCAFRPVWRRECGVLLNRANAFIDEKAKEYDFWGNYPRFQQGDLQMPEFPSSELMEKVRALSPAACMQLLYAISRLRRGEIWYERGGNSLSDLTNYAIRSFGIDIPETSVEILESGLVVISDRPRALLYRKTKEDLFRACEDTGTLFRKSWKKAKVLKSLQSSAPRYVRREVEKLGLVLLNPEFEDQLLTLADSAEKLVRPFKLLCFS
jgi:hypothetical protein